MEFGLFYEIPVPLPWHDRAERDALHAVVAQAVRGEQVGFTHFWTVEHHFLDEFSHCSAPEVLYGAVAAKTSRIKIGHGVRLLPVPYNHPLRVAEMAAMLDCLSTDVSSSGPDGRRRAPSWRGSASTPADTRGMWEEALDVVVGAWTERRLRVVGTLLPGPTTSRAPEAVAAPAPAALGRIHQPGQSRAGGSQGPRAALLHHRRAARGARRPYPALSRRA